MNDISATLAERGGRYGSFAAQAAIEQDLMARLAEAPRWSALAPDQKSAVQMICVKLARITNGDPDYADNWHDIIGYARLIDDRLASAIEARSDETRSGSTEGESAGPKDDAHA
jgi:hypothetical protein